MLSCILNRTPDIAGSQLYREAAPDTAVRDPSSGHTERRLEVTPALEKLVDSMLEVATAKLHWERHTLSRAFSSSLCGMLVHVRCIIVSTQTCRNTQLVYYGFWAPWLHKPCFQPACRVLMDHKQVSIR